MPKFRDRCCNLHNLENHRKTSSLRNVPQNLANRYNLSTVDRICSSCYKKLLHHYAESLSDESDDNEPDERSENDENILTGSIEVDNSGGNNLTDPTTSVGESQIQQSSSSLSELSLEITRPIVNEALLLLNQSPLLARRVNDETYLNNKVSRVADSLKKALGIPNPVDFQCSNTDAAEIITKLREKFHDTNTTKSLRIQMLTLMPSSWSIEKIVEVMGTTTYMARLAINLEADKGILSIPEKKMGHGLSVEVSSAVINFYNDDEMSSPMPGKKILFHCVMMMELHKIFQSRFPGIKIGFSSFASLRPKHCILAGGSGTHTVCVCSIHQNVKLMILGGKLSRLTEGSNMPLKTYSDCVNAIICDNPKTECYFNTCLNCPGIDNIKQLIFTEMDNHAIDEIRYKQWVSTPKVTLETTLIQLETTAITT
ncbi:uncharacterized protein LOC141535849 [Cotesia typhae]|uniref:uncharacterized protein LOC141535849 n=1 Tax=Cotesia typhae TaxID=2053667 RepID=UPI003D683214